MRVFSVIMLILFLTAFVAGFIGIFVEWEGLCSGCPEGHGESCNVLQRARFHSIITTVILGICAVMWGLILWDSYAELRLQNAWAKHITDGDYSHLEKMAECYEKRQ